MVEGIIIPFKETNINFNFFIVMCFLYHVYAVLDSRVKIVPILNIVYFLTLFV